MKQVKLNPGAQERFVNNTHRASAFIGGLGSGKTFANLSRGLIKAQQPKNAFWGPRGCFAAINYPVLKDVVLPQFFEMLDESDLLLDYVRSEKKALLVPVNAKGVPDRTLVKKDGMGASEVLFRSLDQPNWMRGLELSWYGIDEGRHLDGEAWDVLYGRLRQGGYQHSGWVGSTPNGFDWMWTKFHPDSPRRLADSQWYGAPTTDNRGHLPKEYIESLMATYEGRFLRQEVYGEFVGVVDGAVFFAWDHSRHTARCPYDPQYELYSFWDFGMGDLGVCIFAQLRYREVNIGTESKPLLVRQPVLVAIDALEATNRTSKEWVEEVKKHCDRNYGRLPKLNICDPAGRQRSVSTGTSIIEDMAAEGLVMTPAPKKPVDHAVRLVNNMLEGDRVQMDATRCERLTQAMASHKWPVDSSGNRTGVRPVHDWTSHYCDAWRYGTTVLAGFQPQRVNSPDEPKGSTDPTTWGYVFDQLNETEDDLWLGEPESHTIDWAPGLIRPRS